MALPPSVEFTASVGGLATQFCCQRYSDYLFLVVTQLPTFGTLVESRATSNLDGKETVSIRTLLGERDSDIAALCARVVLECVRSDAPAGAAGGGSAAASRSPAMLPVLLGLGLRPENARVEVVRELKAILEERRPWAA